MKILFFSNVFPNPMEPQKGTFNQAMLEAMHQAHDVRVVCPVSWVDEWNYKKTENRRIDHSNGFFVSGIRVDYPRYYYPPKLGRRYYHHFLWWSLKQQLREVCREFQPDVILTYWAHPDGTVALRMARELGIPCVTMVGGSDVLLLARDGSRRRIILDTLRQSSAVVPVSRHLAGCLELDGLSSEKIHPVYRGINSSLFHQLDPQAARKRLQIDPAIPLIVSVGRLVPVKGHSTLIEACKILRGWNQPSCTAIIGNGPLKGPLEQQIAEAGLEDHVGLIDAVPQRELVYWYSAADVVALPSSSEGVPNVLLEAMSCGANFVASGVGGIPEISDPLRDRLVTPENPHDLATALFDSISRRNQDFPERKFTPPSWEESAGELTEVLNRCLVTPKSYVPIPV